MITRRPLLLAALATPYLLAATPLLAQTALSPDDKALVDKAVVYLDAMTSVKGRFTQTDAKGHTASGDFYLKRPGKVRFAYDPPSGLLVVSDGSVVSVEDKRLQTPPEQYPLGLSPLSLFLAKEVKLDRGVKVTKVDHTANGFSITAQDANHKNAGDITLGFSNDPIVLRELTTVDPKSGATRIALSGLTNATLDPDLFFVRRASPQVGPHH